MAVFLQSLLLDIKSSASRKYELVSIVLCSACLALIILVFLSLRSGLAALAESAGADNVVVVLGNGAESEVISSFSLSQVESLSTAVKAEFGSAVSLSPELFTNIRAGGSGANDGQIVAVRGVGPQAYDSRRDIQLQNGRLPAHGKREVMVGRSLAARSSQFALGQQITLGSLQWTIVGWFSSAESVVESEIWGDLHQLQDAYNRPGMVQSVRITLSDAEQAQQLVRFLSNRQQHTNIRAQTQRQFFSGQINEMTAFSDVIAIPSIAILLLATGFSGLQSLHTMMEARRRETAVLRALGFPAQTLALSVFALAILLSLAGAAAGVLAGLALFSQIKAVVMNHQSLSEMVFPFVVTPLSVLWCTLAAVSIAVIGGGPAALVTLRTHISTAIRKN